MATEIGNERLNKLFMRIPKRSEGVDRSVLVQTFVDLDPLLTLLSTTDHQVVYGRRGTGKTHALLFLSELNKSEKQLGAYVDMRTIGSSGGIYSDSSVLLSERGTRLLIDTMEALHESLLTTILDDGNDFDLSVLGPSLDAMASAITEVKVTGTVEETEVASGERTAEKSGGFSLGMGEKGLSGLLSSNDKNVTVQKTNNSITRKGVAQHRVHFGSLSNALQDIAKSLKGKRIWLLLDEWSAVPLDLQPLLADLIRRSILPVPGFSVKIGAIEHRTLFQEHRERGDYLGIELGADVSADVNLDDFMVFDNSAERAKTFFSQLIYKHAVQISIEDESPLPEISHEGLMAQAFSRRDVFEEYVRAGEGVPRDAINILSFAARQAGTGPITMENVRSAAKLWYERDKQAAVNSNPNASGLLFRIIDEVIGHRRTRAFLIKSNVRHELIDDLFDKRVVHVLKRNVSSNDQAGVRYDVFKIDYGCYVDLLTTFKAPGGLFQSEDGSFVEVPPDDYRSIRRAILDIDSLLGKAAAPVEAAASSEAK